MTAIAQAELQLDAMAAVFEAAVGEFECPCGERFEFGSFDGLDEYAALNRWLGGHFDNCTVALLRAHAKLAALCRAQADEIRQLSLRLDQVVGKRGGW